MDEHARSRTEADGELADERLGDLPPELLRRLPQRDPAALQAFFDAYFARVYGYVRRLVGEEHLAEDLTQDVFMHIHRALHTYDPERGLRPWVFTIATNKVRDWWRSRRFRDGQHERSVDDEEGGTWLPDLGLGPRAELENRELGQALAEAVEALPESMKSAFLLRWSEGLSFEEIGRILERNEEAARKRYSRALDALRQALGPRLGRDAGGRA